jgi:hypothetical protein
LQASERFQALHFRRVNREAVIGPGFEQFLID